MAFTVGYDGNSYVSVAYADGRFADRRVTAWTGTNDDKQGALIRATDYVRALFAPRFDPAKVAVDLLPDTLLAAVSEYALVELSTPGGLVPQTGDSAVDTVVIKEKVGPIETQYAVVGGAANAVAGTRKSFPVADALITRLLLPSTGLSRVIR